MDYAYSLSKEKCLVSACFLLDSVREVMSS